MGTKVILVLVGIGLILGLALIGSEVVNPLSGLSGYERARVETQIFAEQKDIYMKGQEARQQQVDAMESQRLAEAIRHQREMDALKKQMLEDQFNHQQQLQEKELQRIQTWADFEKALLDESGAVLPWALGLAAIILSIGLSFRIASTPMVTPAASRMLFGILALTLAGSATATIVLLMDYLAALGVVG